MVELQRSEAKPLWLWSNRGLMEEQMNAGNVEDGNGKDGGMMKMPSGERKKNPPALHKFICWC